MRVPSLDDGADVFVDGAGVFSLCLSPTLKKRLRFIFEDTGFSRSFRELSSLLSCFLAPPKKLCLLDESCSLMLAEDDDCTGAPLGPTFGSCASDVPELL